MTQPAHGASRRNIRWRGYFDATSAEELGKAEWKDPAWLTWLHGAFSDMASNPYVLVTYDNEMIVTHAPLLDAYETTLAVIDKRAWERSGLTQEEYWREVIHRHAHRFAAQPLATIVKYRASERTSKVTLKL